MPQSTEFRVRTFSGFRAWVTIALVVAIGVAILGAVAVVTIGILLFVLPVLILAAFLSYVFMWLRGRGRPRRSPQDPTILEGEYRVLVENQIRQHVEDNNTPSDPNARS